MNWTTNIPEDSATSKDPCTSNYRGPKAFSEPEIQAIKELVEKYANIKFAINFHAYGNFICIPFNSDKEANPQLNKFKEANTFYTDL